MKPEEAMEELRVIRQIMSKNISPLIISGWEVVSWGLMILIGGLITHYYSTPGDPLSLSPRLGILWIFLLLTASILETFFYVRTAHKEGLPLLSPIIVRFYLGFSALIIAGSAFHLIFHQQGLFLHIPGSWMLIAGAGYIYVGLFVIMEFWILGLITMVGGLLALGPFLDYSFLVTALFAGAGWILWGLWINRRRGG